jgi:hypothetical protein
MGLVGAAATVPLAGIQYALGAFNDGLLGLEQAGEFVGASASMVMIVCFLAPWVLRGFAVRARDDDEADEPRSSSLSRLPQPAPHATPHAAPHAAAPSGAHSRPPAQQR